MQTYVVVVHILLLSPLFLFIWSLAVMLVALAYSVVRDVMRDEL